MKLSPAQLNVLFQLRAGEILHHITGLNSSWFISTEGPPINYRTIYKLMDLGFIEETDELHPKGILTDKGRTYLESIKDEYK